MEQENIFAKASRLRLRFETVKGILSVEDLWQLPLTANNGRLSLDDVAIAVATRLKEKEGVGSFVNTNNKTADLDELRLDICKYIIDYRKAEKEAAANAKANKEKKEKLLQILEEKKDKKFESMSEAELEAIINAL